MPEKASESPQTAITSDEQQRLEAVQDMSIQARFERAVAGSTSHATWFFFGREAETEIAPWWSELRDRDLRGFALEEGNDILQGAISSITKKFTAMPWVVEGPRADLSHPAPGTADYHQRILSTAESGQGWGTLLRKSLQDYLTQDKGMFWELIGPGDPLGPIEEPGVMGIAHLDAAKCQLTGDVTYPVIFHNSKTGGAHKIHATRVAHASDMTSPNENMNGIGFCATSRVIASSQVLLKLAQYENERLSDLPEAGLLLLNNILPLQWEDVKEEHQRGRRKLGHELWNNILTLIGLDPQQPVSAQFISFANLPEHFDKKETIDVYVNIVALSFGVDTREFWPISGQPLGTATETMIQHQKARGKGVGDVISMIERIINWKVLPSSVSFYFDFREDEEDALRANTVRTITETIMKMWEPRKTGLEGIEEWPVSVDEIRQMLADNVPYFSEEFLLQDTTLQTRVTDTERRGYGPLVCVNSKGKVYPVRIGRRAGRIDRVLSEVRDNYQQGLIDAERLAEYAVGELLDRQLEQDGRG